MAATPSSMPPLGMKAPDFTLPDYSGTSFSLNSFQGPGLLVAFICSHCPFVVHIRKEFGSFAREYGEKGLDVVAIVSNDLDQYPQDGPEGMRREAEEGGYDFPYLLDETQEVAKAYRAACTPDFFLFDRDRKLAYRGQFDGSRPGNGLPVTGEDLRSAAHAVLAGGSVPEPHHSSIGCNIKWKPGNAPDYFG
ncbi:MAG: thioredoxin family protein [Gemmatimonadetes bacterium]|nr:thioredoxin family protein [Gemmatimonadota bacterium]NNM04105.1 thioredoxin family protein [Gemmatimonadota bacterium]